MDSAIRISRFIIVLSVLSSRKRYAVELQFVEIMGDLYS